MYKTGRRLGRETNHPTRPTGTLVRKTHHPITPAGSDQGNTSSNHIPLRIWPGKPSSNRTTSGTDQENTVARLIYPRPDLKYENSSNPHWKLARPPSSLKTVTHTHPHTPRPKNVLFPLFPKYFHKLQFIPNISINYNLAPTSIKFDNNIIISFYFISSFLRS